MGEILVFVEHDQGQLSPSAGEALTAARELGERLSQKTAAVLVGQAAEGLGTMCAEYGVQFAYCLTSPVLSDYGPETWGQAIVELANQCSPSVILSVGTDRGNEVLAQVAARLSAPFAANSTVVQRGDAWEITRVQWGGSLLEDIVVDSELLIASYNHHSIEPAFFPGDNEIEVRTVEVELDPTLGRTVIRDRVTLTEGVTLSTASVVVSGGRGVGSAEGFAQLEELADLLGGRVGCSRAVTNNGWRSHTDQVGQTGTRIAPEIYIACGISGAIQHWVGAMASKNILAINTDREANMVTKAGYAVIADLHEVIPAVIEEVKRRRS
ncbi:MAG TPA: electron transfer flavoprotein subunit alpha/FixB family protein [Acidimicrobiia bacterium]|jgi:electron transfer flavoprotein alpha subunit|nr:electron transfer flavoprotein subunit alpha/FixB family protein [Acidimicrobiia bacterium]HIL06996.1 electron transfer flavoprotein subunit alpha/FixB family protein [Acidimicrobiia bacterium]